MSLRRILGGALMAAGLLLLLVLAWAVLLHGPFDGDVAVLLGIPGVMLGGFGSAVMLTEGG